MKQKVKLLKEESKITILKVAIQAGIDRGIAKKFSAKHHLKKIKSNKQRRTKHSL